MLDENGARRADSGGIVYDTGVRTWMMNAHKCTMKRKRKSLMTIDEMTCIRTTSKPSEEVR